MLAFAFASSRRPALPGKTPEKNPVELINARYCGIYGPIHTHAAMRVHVLLDSLYEACIHEWFARRADALPVPIDHSLNPNHVHAGTAYACDSWLSPERHARGAGGKDTPRGERR